ncbi:MAG: NAD-binding protein [Lentisphaeria bacterium]
MKKETIGWGLVGVAALGLFACGTIGFLQADFLPLNALYSAIQLFVLECPGECENNLLINIARFFSPLLLALTAIFSFIRALQKRQHDWKLSHLKNHVVICGLGRKGHELARRLMPDDKVVIIERDENNDYAETCQDAGAFFLCGDAAEAAMLKKARIEFAREAYLFTGSDGSNFSSLVTLASLCSNKEPDAKKISVWLHLKTLEMCSFLRNEKIIESVRKKVELQAVNLFETAARDLVINHLVPLLPVRPDDKRRIHLIQIGFGRMGQAIVRKLAQTAVTVNYQVPKATIVSLNAQKDMDALVGEIPQIQSFCDLQAEDGDILRGGTRQRIAGMVRTALETGEVPVICLAVNRQFTNVSAALFLAELFKTEGFSRSDNVPLFVRQIESEGWTALVNDLSQQEAGTYRHIKGFGDLSNLCSEESLNQSRLDRMALAVHQAYLDANNPEEKPTHQSWEKLNWNTKQSNRLAVDHIRVKLRTIGLDCTEGVPGDPALFVKRVGKHQEELGRLEHCRWMTAKQLANWTVGEKTDYKEKIHACLVKWEQLPEKEKQKDYSQILAIPDILRAGGYSIIAEGSIDE